MPKKASTKKKGRRARSQGSVRHMPVKTAVDVVSLEMAAEFAAMELADEAQLQSIEAVIGQVDPAEGTEPESMADEDIAMKAAEGATRAAE